MGATLKHIVNLLSLSCILLLSPAGGANALASDGAITGTQRTPKGAKQQGKRPLISDHVAGAVAAFTFASGKDNSKRDEIEAYTSATTQRGVADSAQRATVSRGSGGGSKPAVIKLPTSSSAAVLPSRTAVDTVAIATSGTAVAARNATADSRGKSSGKKAVSATAVMRYQRPHSALMASRLTFLHAMDHWRSHGGGNTAAAVAAARRLRGGAAALAAAKRLRGARHDGGGGGGSARSSGSTAAVVPL
ncbi:hypothetical protein VaNZ11_001676 [Volvox africanus]|uniref:Uncharacterized protein n=1 Tax=Volvox africanus TaxID=51714 RepID=A0ABQ5RQK5_9CHLO|nr:hypothetical protein VaNZ11_001676 [Volvox africanus]